MRSRRPANENDCVRCSFTRHTAHGPRVHPYAHLREVVPHGEAPKRWRRRGVRCVRRGCAPGVAPPHVLSRVISRINAPAGRAGQAETGGHRAPGRARVCVGGCARRRADKKRKRKRVWGKRAGGQKRQKRKRRTGFSLASAPAPPADAAGRPCHPVPEAKRCPLLNSKTDARPGRSLTQRDRAHTGALLFLRSKTRRTGAVPPARSLTPHARRPPCPHQVRENIELRARGSVSSVPPAPTPRTPTR